MIITEEGQGRQDRLAGRNSRFRQDQRRSKMEILAYIIVGYFAALVLRTYWWQYKAMRYGIETDGTVSWTEDVFAPVANGNDFSRRHYNCYYVRFLKEDGREAEARLLNGKKRLVPGSKVKIMYDPGKDQVAVLTEIIKY